ncbi:bifunctional demethylmenaquinone methyltransferase/2-methoxy-6-polyprenyl-1,4-benzoquinol methylase UbiE [Bacteriovorax sp. PP10]|jgi:demethylmenaquinone methyltransferase/2-methoxy-6-polyprenyl-1,4-benzoquinol methylase|uniref:Demethylmenaquinone methyltransferase n=1 Tax=Bacteriovorax antarcticus TaxID=3088717 RepID=A0ABU5VYR9_9BACT|nr:bifunctional demethylmenaquinone methyltransferase/2-methoxy-6-polyprenyl-1,4-benzoquinol methylase UbiE [Bacteriovorax sp. PP10]MEA9358207.1 bifunctional demethylmenaquinone methyltransferase/2-methoxy-6-polyprenyl-1,4-benzoquinol methylase UbiE [Bacteriovorax sp. PP10]
MTNELDARKKESYKIFDDIAGTYDLLNHSLSMGIDVYWRNKMLKHLPNKESINALDLATGTGDVALTLVKDKRVKKITGLDLSKGMIDVGIKKVKKKGLEKKIFLMLGDGVSIPTGDAAFDLTTISFGIRNFSDPQKSLHDIHRVLKRDGRLMIMEFSIPTNFIVRNVYFFYFRHLLPFIGNIVSKHKDAYTYLNKSVEDFPYGDKFLGMMRTAGFQDLKMIPLTFGIATLYIGDKK